METITFVNKYSRFRTRESALLFYQIKKKEYHIRSRCFYRVVGYLVSFLETREKRGQSLATRNGKTEGEKQDFLWWWQAVDLRKSSPHCKIFFTFI